MLKACLNGPRTAVEHPALPVTVPDIVRDVVAVRALGVELVHVHVKDPGGNDTLDGAALVAMLAAARDATVGVEVGVTTGAWTVPDPERRVAAIRSWGRMSLLPDFASVNWHEDGADDVAGALLDLGVAVEAGLWHAEGADAWLGSPLRDNCVRVLIELPDGLGEAESEQEAARLLERVRGGMDTAKGDVPVLLHGEGSSTWPALRLASRLGLDMRIGLEDTLLLPDGPRAPGNAALVRAAQEIIAGPVQ